MKLQKGQTACTLIRLLCLLCSFVIVLLGVTACGASLTAEEYKTALKDGFSAYREASSSYASYLKAGQYALAAEYAQKAKEPLDTLAGLNAPEQLKAEQTALAQGIVTEKEYLDMVTKFADYSGRYDSLAAAELEDYNALNKKMEDVTEGSPFIEAYLAVYKAVKSETAG